MRNKGSKGRYWDKAWSLVDGCTPCSPGCEHCWSAAISHRFKREGEPVTNQKGRFNGDIFVYYSRLNTPLYHRKPTIYAIWNDLFHEKVSFDFLYKAYEVKGLPDTYQGQNNIWHGLTVCNQREADEKIPVFLQVPGKKFLSIEPMLEAIDISKWLPQLVLNPGKTTLERETFMVIDAVILGGETGPGARPMHPDWVRSVRDQCKAADVPFFFKGWGTWQPSDSIDFYNEAEKTYTNGRGRFLTGTKKQVFHQHNPSKIIYWVRVGSKKAGRLLDGQEHNDLPWRGAEESFKNSHKFYADWDVVESF